MATEEEIRRVARALLIAVGDVGENAADEIMKATEHSGDCTKQPWTCNVCYSDEHRQMAGVAISEMRAIEREKAEESLESDEFDNYVANARYGREYLTKSGT